MYSVLRKEQSCFYAILFWKRISIKANNSSEV